MAVCDTNYIFTLIDVGVFGSQSDGEVFKDSAFGRALDNNKLEIPDDSCLPGTDIKFPCYMVADEAFPLKSYIMRPYPGTQLNKTQKSSIIVFLEHVVLLKTLLELWPVGESSDQRLLQMLIPRNELYVQDWSS